MIGNNSESDKSDESMPLPWYAGWKFFAGSLAAIFLVWYFYRTPLRQSGGIEQAAQFGDMYGALNTLFSGFAFAGLIWAILLQRVELKQSNMAFKRTARAQEDSLKLLKRQISAAEERETRDLSPLFIEYVKEKDNPHGKYSSRSNDCIALVLQNIGGLARNVQVTSPVPGNIVVSERGFVTNDTALKVKHYLMVGDGDKMEKERATLKYSITCKDLRGTDRSFVFCYDLAKNQIYESFSEEVTIQG